MITLAAAVGAASRGDAAPAAAPAPAPPTVFIVAGPKADPELIAALSAAKANLAQQGVNLQTLHVADERHAARARDLIDSSGALGVFWFDRPRPGELRAVLMSPGGAFVRRIPVEAGEEETTREAAWLIVESGALALTQGQAPAMEEADVEALAEDEPPLTKSEPVPGPPTADEEPPPPAEPPPRFGGALTVGYVGQGIANPIPWQSGAGIGGVLDIGPLARLAVNYAAMVPWRSGEPTVRWRHRAELRAGARFEIGDRVTLHALAGVGVEGQQWRSSDDGGGGWRVVASVGVDGGLAIRLFGPVALWIEPGMDAPLNRFDFVECSRASAECSGTERRVALQPWFVRPRLRAGVAVHFPTR